MNKVAKATIAAAAGVILLMGGAGSLAYWNDTANAGPASGNIVTGGTLQVTAVNAGSWTKAFYNGSGTQVIAPAPVSNLANVLVVPGNRLVYTQTFTLAASGDDLWFTIGKTNGAVTASSGAAADLALAAQIGASGTSAFAVGSITGGNVVASTTAGTYKVSSNTGGPSTVTVTWTIDFPFRTVVDNGAKLGAVTLTQGAITLTQVAAP